MDFGIEGKWALVCGASKGLGLGCAQALVGEGVNLVINARAPDALHQAASQLIAIGADRVSAGGQNDYQSVQAVLEQRCYLCHGAAVQMKNLRLDSPDSVKQHAQAIYQQVVVQKLMPMNNATQITDAERALIGRWFEAGAPTGP